MSHSRERASRDSGMLSSRTKVVLAASAVLIAVATGILLTSWLPRSGASGPGPRAAAASPTAPFASRSPSHSAVSHAPVRRRNPFSASSSYVASRSGSVLAAIYDISTGQTWNLRLGRPQPEASIVKLDILETLLARNRDTGHGTGLPATESSLAQRMIEDSDNDAATSLWYASGGPAKIRAFNAAAGLTQTSPSRCVQCPGFPWPGWGLTTTTAADQITLLRQLFAPGSELTLGQRSYVLQLMENVTPSQRWGVSGGVPLRAMVALKNGWLPLNGSGTDWQINSIGWISGRGRDYLMAVLTTGNPTEQYGIDTITALSAIVWKAMR
jgi:Beta-lactamase enzyme family